MKKNSNRRWEAKRKKKQRKQTGWEQKGRKEIEEGKKEVGRKRQRGIGKAREKMYYFKSITKTKEKKRRNIIEIKRLSGGKRMSEGR